MPYSDATSIAVSDGNNIVTNIDISVQRIAEEAAKEAYDKYDPIDGVCAIVMNPYTGAVYAMVSIPNYDCNDPYAKPYGKKRYSTMRPYSSRRSIRSRAGPRNHSDTTTVTRLWKKHSRIPATLYLRSLRRGSD